MTQPTISPVVLLVAALVFGALAFGVSERFRRRHGVTPWRWPSLLWAFIGFLSLLVFAILVVIASLQTTKKLEAGAYGPGPRANGYPTGPGHPGWVPPPGVERESGAGPPGLDPGAGPVPPPSWHPDPGGRHQFRYWDGSAWTEYVSDHGHQSSDPPPS